MSVVISSVRVAKTAFGGRTRWGLLLAATLGAVTWLLIPSGPEGLGDPGRWTAAIAVAMAVLWMTEALPLPATALLPVVLFPLTEAAPMAETVAPYASEVIFLFLGGFILALAIERAGLHRRIALLVLSVCGTRPSHLVGGFMAATAFLSMWINNTATTLMMLPIGLSILRRLKEEVGAPSRLRGLGPALLLGIAYASSLGSLGTPVGTAPNLLLRGFLQRTHGIELGFGAWMAAVMPLSLGLLFVTWLFLTRVVFRGGDDSLPVGSGLWREARAGLGPMSGPERVALCVFVGTALAWIFREPVTHWLSPSAPALSKLTDAGIAVFAALLLFAIPVGGERQKFAMDWEAAQRLPWGTLLLFGGGLSLAGAVQRNGVDALIGSKLAALGHLPAWALVLLVVAVVLLLTELTSNTAVTATFLPVLGGVAAATGVEPLQLLVPAALAATCAFMMPVATPPNALVHATGEVSLREMARAGVWLNLFAVGAISVFALTAVRWLG